MRNTYRMDAVDPVKSSFIEMREQGLSTAEAADACNITIKTAGAWWALHQRWKDKPPAAEKPAPKITKDAEMPPKPAAAATTRRAPTVEEQLAQAARDREAAAAPTTIWQIDKHSPAAGWVFVEQVAGRPPSARLQTFGNGQYRIGPMGPDGKPIEALCELVTVAAPGTAVAATANTAPVDPMTAMLQFQLQQAQLQATRDERERKERREEDQRRRDEDQRREDRSEKRMMEWAGLLLPIVTPLLQPKAETSNDRLTEFLLASAKNQQKSDPLEAMAKAVAIKTMARELRDVDDDKDDDPSTELMKMGAQFLPALMGGQQQQQGGQPQPEGINARALVGALKRNPEAMASIFEEISNDPEALASIEAYAAKAETEKQAKSAVSGTDKPRSGPKPLRKVG